MAAKESPLLSAVPRPAGGQKRQRDHTMPMPRASSKWSARAIWRTSGNKNPQRDQAGLAPDYRKLSGEEREGADDGEIEEEEGVDGDGEVLLEKSGEGDVVKEDEKEGDEGEEEDEDEGVEEGASELFGGVFEVYEVGGGADLGGGGGGGRRRREGVNEENGEEHADGDCCGHDSRDLGADGGEDAGFHRPEISSSTNGGWILVLRHLF
ncbi:hypothetical protein L484_012791 [Morus notabilis]|uniref:Uncharacterized protein n=1 Tax=Morus notabilis TaxID=981085 RepID=W9SAZ2_9ROSA|nr:hypothetical protein L484_012791 [Morus notabilis]